MSCKAGVGKLRALYILGDILTLAERIMAAPCDTLTDILPGIAYFMEEGGLDKAVEGLAMAFNQMPF